MRFHVTCPSCTAAFAFDPAAGGFSGPCDQCGASFRAKPSQAYRRRFCSAACYWRWMRTPKAALVVRFWRYVEKSDDSDACWPWRGARDPRGYGSLHGYKQRNHTVKAHRLSWEIANGPIPAGLHVMHRCDQPSCVNPRHLSVGTHRENQADKARKGRAAKRLSAADAREIRRLHDEAGFGQPALAEAFGVHKSMISLIVRGESWRHVD